MQISNDKNQNFILNFKIFTLTFISLIFTFSFLILNEAQAHCPLCVAGAGAGLGISRWLGIDDSITGLWMAAFLGATALWMVNLIEASGPKGLWPGGKKFIPFQKEIIYIATFGLTLTSFYQFNLINEHAGLIMGVPKLTFGIVLGGVVFYLIDFANNFIKKTKGKVLFPYQPVVFSIAGTTILSMGMWIFINYYI